MSWLSWLSWFRFEAHSLCSMCFVFFVLFRYANYDGTFLVVTKGTTPPPNAALATDKFFLELVGVWLTTTTSGTITLIVICVLMCVLCSGCMFACCCEHESLHKHHDAAPTTFSGKALRQISSLIGSRLQDHNHVYVAVVFGGVLGCCFLLVCVVD